MFAPTSLETLRQSSVEVRSRAQGGGSGIVWTAEGLIVTNAHVLRGRNPIVRLADGREFPAAILHADRERDLAVLRIDARPLSAATIGDSSTVRTGHIVAAIGNPLGVVGAASAGIVHSTSDPRWIQADLRLAPGNSGGMLVDHRGHVIGVNTMIYAGIAIAIPSNAASAFVRDTLSRTAHQEPHRKEQRAA